MRDKRSYQIKKILKNKFPDSKFKVKIDKYSMGESIYIYADLIKQIPNGFFDLEWKRRVGEHLSAEEYELYKKGKMILENNNQIEQEIKQLLKTFWHVDYDEYTHEILSGGNTFLFVERLN